MCEYIGISRSVYYRWLRRKGNRTQQQETNDYLKSLIKNYHEIYPTKGYRSVRKEIKIDTGWIVSYYLMYQCFKELGIYSKAKRRAYRRPKGVSDKYKNIIGGDWSTSGPFEKVCSDMHCYEKAGHIVPTKVWKSDI